MDVLGPVAGCDKGSLRERGVREARLWCLSSRFLERLLGRWDPLQDMAKDHPWVFNSLMLEGLLLRYHGIA